MIYVTVKQSPRYHQMSLEELLFEKNPRSYQIDPDTTSTRTYLVEDGSAKQRLLQNTDVDALTHKLEKFLDSTVDLRTRPRKELYSTYHIPKKSGGLRRIDQPCSELMSALRNLKSIFENDFHALYHTSAFAYIKRRSHVLCMKKHQSNQSRWYAKYDISNFFGSTTLEWTLKMFSMIFPFSEVVKTERGYNALRGCLELAFLNNGLPQGTPVSPTITNIMMIPVDYTISKRLRSFKCYKGDDDGEEDTQHFIYTRYADDFQITSRYNFDFRQTEKLIVDVLAYFEAPFKLKTEKTRYGSYAGRNWNLGLMINANNEMTVGYKKKRQLQAMLSSYVQDHKNNVKWDISDIQTMEGYRNYYRMVEGDTIDRIVAHLNEKFSVDIVRMIREDLRS